jgi:hypothetical protein
MNRNLLRFRPHLFVQHGAMHIYLHAPTFTQVHITTALTPDLLPPQHLAPGSTAHAVMLTMPMDIAMTGLGG